MAKRIKMRRIATINNAGRGEVIKEPIPAVKPGQVLIRVRAASISPGSELHAPRLVRAGEKLPADYRIKLGYQNSGEVIEVGRGVKQFKKGDRVSTFGGGYSYIADFTVAPQNLCCKLPDKVSFVEGAYGNVMLTGLHAIRRGDGRLGENLLVAGMGIVGQFTAQFGRIAGMNVMCWDALPLRLRIGKQCGAHKTVNIKRQDTAATSKTFTGGNGFDMAAIAFAGDGTAALETIKSTMQLSPDGHETGRVVMVGAPTAQIQGGTGLGNLDIRGSARTGPGYHDDDWEHGRTHYPKTFMRWTTRTNYELSLNLIARGELNVKALTTHKLPIAKVDDAIYAHIDQPHKTLGTVIVLD